MMFSSRNSEDLPYRAGQAVTIYPATINGQSGSVVTREFVQHNQPNPILVKLREEDRPIGRRWTAGYVVNGRYPTTIEHYLFQIGGAENAPILTEIGLGVKVAPAQIQHARAVLTRLAKLSEGI